jgi:DNA topoisomerase-3
MEHGKFSREKFMAEIVEVTKGIVDRTKNFEEDESNSRVTDIVSPTDGKPMLETLRAYKSQDGVLAVYKVITGRKMEESEIRALIAQGEIGPLDGFVSPRTGNRFPAKLRIVVDPKDEAKKRVELDFGNKVEVNELTPFWTDPKTGAELCEAPTNYILREREGDGWKQAFSVGRLMCQKPIERAHAIQLVEQGKTEVIKGFISKRGRPFDAMLLKNGPKIGWEFPPREKKEGKEGGKSRAPRKEIDLSKAKPVGTSKAHDGAEVLQTDDGYYVRKDGPGGRVVFKMARAICQLEIPVGEVHNLLDHGRTNLLEGFISKRGSKFSAYLVLSANKAKADFEFPPR